jgi:hypothetical protein
LEKQNLHRETRRRGEIQIIRPMARQEILATAFPSGKAVWQD